MPVLVVLPAIAGFAAGFAVVATEFTILGMSLTMTAVAAGAVAGAVVGGLGAAITGGDIGEGVLYGAVGGYLGGAYSAGGFGQLAAKDAALVSQESSTGVLAGDINPVAKPPALGPGGAPPVVDKGMSDMAQYALISGGASMLKGSPKEAYSTTKEGLAQSEEAQAKLYADKAKSDKEIADAANVQRKYESDQTYKSNVESLAYKQTELDKTIAQRKLELETPLQKAIDDRNINAGTASGLTLASKQKAANDEIEQYLKA